jgi:hydrogenase-4 membrane subunit HyfE
MDWLSFTIASSRRANGLVFGVVQIENGKLWFTTIFNIGIGIIVPASVETTDLALNLKYSPDVAARVLKSG